MIENKIDYSKIEGLIKNGLLQVMDDNYNYYQGNEIIITTDVQFQKEKNKKPGCIYIVLQFSPASINFGQVVLPVTITAISEQNKLKVCKQLLIDYVYTYNQTKSENGTIFQIYESPVVSSNFQTVFEGFRSVLNVDGTFIISENASFFDLTYNYKDKNGDEQNDYVEFISGQLDYSTQPDTQPFNFTKNFTKSEIRFSTLSFTITTFATSDSPLIKDIIKVVMKKETNNKTFNFDVDFLNIETLNDNFKLINFSASQKIADMPMIVATFAN